MWRKSLHDELGLFDEDFETAGDYEFWLRCAAAEKKFYKIKDPIVAYYYSPDGLSTRPNGSGIAEALIAVDRYRPGLVKELYKFNAKMNSTQIAASAHIGEIFTRDQLNSLKELLGHES
jgi:hypothetical protein